MAKVNGPLMSMDASGGFGGAIVFGKWKGRNTARQLITPANPHSETQEEARNRIRVAGVDQHFVNVTEMMYPGSTQTDKELIVAITPASYAWNGYLVDIMIGNGALNYEDARSAYAALGGPAAIAWDAAAAALEPAIPDVYQTQEGGLSDTPLSKGEAFFILEHTLALMGLHPSPTATPPVYA